MTSPSIALVMNAGHPNHLACRRGLETYLERHGLPWSVHLVHDPDQIRLPDTCWAVVLHHRDTERWATSLDPRHTLVVFGQQRGGMIRVDRASIGRLAADHLIDRGFRRLAVIETDHTARFADQRAAFLDRGSERGVPVTTYRLQSVADEPAFIDRLAADSATIACHCYTDGQAAWLRQLALTAGLQVPEHLAIIGTGDQPNACLRQAPHLTSVAWPWALIGDVIGHHLHHRILGQEAPLPQPLTLFRVCERASTEPPAHRHPLIAQAETWLSRHLTCKRPLAETAAALGCGQSTLTLAFRRHGHATVQQTLERLRLERACALLADGNEPVGRIGTRCGYASPTAFGIAFKRRHGLSPGRWRSLHGA